MSRFAVKYSDQELFAAVAAIARAEQPEDPTKITQARFNDARASHGYKDLSRADRIAKRLKRPWGEVLEISLKGGFADQSTGAREAVRIREKLTPAEVRHYLQMIARNLGTEALPIHAYDEERERLVEKDNRRHVHRQETAGLIPTSQTIVQIYGSWDKALSIAELRNEKRNLRPNYPAELALADFMDDHGFIPTLGMLRQYQKKRGLKTAWPRGRYTEWRDEQLKTGPACKHPVMPVIELHADAPRGWEDKPVTPAPDGYATFTTAPHDLERCLNDLKTAVELAEGESLTQDLYQQLSARHGLVAVGTIQAVGRQNGGLTWGDMRDRAVAEASKRARSQRRDVPRR